jgi:S1-C subfamily serine protease
MEALPSDLESPKAFLLRGDDLMRINVFLFVSTIAVSLFLGQANVHASTQEQPNEEYLLGWTAYQAGEYAEAKKTWQPLAEKGDPSAQLNLGTLYDYGQGVSEDPAQAMHWYNAAAEQGKAIAQFNLGVMYATGRGTHLDHAQASRWYFKAAEQGVTDAQFNLALQFSQGLGVEANAELANQWLYRAGKGYLAAGLEQHVKSVIQHMNDLGGASQLAQELSEQLSSMGHPDTKGDWENASVGTGWPIAAGYVVTNDHVVGDSENIVLVDPAGNEIVAKVVARNAKQDLALLSVLDPSQLPPALQLASQLAKLGTSVFTIGFPRIDLLGKTPKLTAGLVSSINGMADDTSRYQLSLPIQPGNSGGPLINMHGEVVGVITSMLGTVDASGNSTPLSNISYAVKVNALQQLLSTVPKSEPRTNLIALNDTNLENLADTIQHSVLIVRAK